MAKQLLKGNIAVAEAAIRAGVQAYFGYPIDLRQSFRSIWAVNLWILQHGDFHITRQFAGGWQQVFRKPVNPLTIGFQEHFFIQGVAESHHHPAFDRSKQISYMN